MKTLLITIAILFSLGLNAQENYKISRYEQTGEQLFICINSTEVPVYIEHFFTEGEKSTPDSIKITIEGLLAELEIKADAYVAPEPLQNKIVETKKFSFSKRNVATKKAKKIKEKLAKNIKENPIKEVKKNNKKSNKK